MSEVPAFLAANARYASSFTKGQLSMPPARRVAVVACMDARLDPARVLGLEEGDAHVIRNAGGRARDAIRSLVISQQLLGTREVVVVHHTDCGMLTFTDDDLKRKIRQELKVETEIDFLSFADLDQSREFRSGLSCDPTHACRVEFEQERPDRHAATLHFTLDVIGYHLCAAFPRRLIARSAPISFAGLPARAPRG